MAEPIEIHRPCQECQGNMVEVEGNMVEVELVNGATRLYLCGPCFRQAVADLVINNERVSFRSRLKLSIHVVEVRK